MTFRDWLSKYNIQVRFTPRGFNIENDLGQAQFVEVLDPAKRVTRFIDDDDVQVWLKKNIKNNSLFSREAQNDFRILAR